jgi:muramoyltetrapeptide carboxypeptidase
VRKPKALPSGGTIGLISPSSPVDSHRLQLGIAVLESRGFQVKCGAHVSDYHGHLAGLDQDRAADLFSVYADPNVDAILCARGGSSSCRLWPLIDWFEFANLPPKLFIGYSDITSLHIPFNQKSNIVTIHGPVLVELGTKTPPPMVDWLLRLLQSTDPLGIVPECATDTLVSGSAEGLLCGGNLSLIAGTIGTSYQIDVTDKLLLIEDIGETPWHIERYLIQLREAGILQRAAGFIIGEATNADTSTTLPMRQIWSELLAPLAKPTVLGFPFGHVLNNYSLPLGINARLDAGHGTLELLEAAVRNS